MISLVIWTGITVFVVWSTSRIVQRTHEKRIQNLAAQWYQSHPAGTAKPDYVLESDRLRRARGLE
jgi:hypothetical protein